MFTKFIHFRTIYFSTVFIYINYILPEIRVKNINRKQLQAIVFGLLFIICESVSTDKKKKSSNNNGQGQG